MKFFVLLAGLWLLFPGSVYAADATPAVAYFPILPFDASPEASPQLLPVAANHALDVVLPGITRAIIIIHDETRDASAALALMTALTGVANKSTILLAPQFLIPSDLIRFADRLPEKGRSFASWDMGAWSAGDDSVPSAPFKSVSSFTAVDLLLMYLSDRTRFPDLQNIVVVGYGVGANFVQRYAALGLATDKMIGQNIGMHFLVVGASSYLYMTGNRPLGRLKGFGRPDVAVCPAYDAYPYGLDKLNAYARRVGANAAKTNYVQHAISYLNTAGGDRSSDMSCAALAQGADSISRALSFNLYLQSLYGEAATTTQTFAASGEMKNDAASLLGSSCGMAVLFGDGLCPQAIGGGQ